MVLATKTAGDGSVWISRSDLEREIFAGQVPETEQCRRYYGRALTPATIEAVARNAELGFMRDMTDLIGETLFIDPHFSSVVGKRFRSLAAMRPKVIPAEGDGIDAAFANELADGVRQQLAWLPTLPQCILQLNWGHCHGRAALEKVWVENRTGRIQWRIDGLNWLHPRRLSFGPERELRVRDDLYAGGGFERRGLALRDFPEKFIEFLPQLFNEYPEKEGFGPRGLYFSFFKRFGWRERMSLMEVYGKPWRIVFVQPDSTATVQKEQLDEAQASVDRLGANASARLPRGVDLKTEQPGKGAGEIHREVASECDDQISKLVLGQTRTTDAAADGLGGQQALVMQDEQLLVIAGDGWNLGPALTEGIAASWTRVNYGPEALAHCPSIVLEFQVPPDRKSETERTKVAISIGVPLKEDEVYEAIGFARPEPGDRIVQQQEQTMPGPFGAETSAPAPQIGVMPGDAAADLDGGGSPLGAAATEDGASPLAARARVRRLRLLRASSGAS